MTTNNTTTIVETVTNTLKLSVDDVTIVAEAAYYDPIYQHWNYRKPYGVTSVGGQQHAWELTTVMWS